MCTGAVCFNWWRNSRNARYVIDVKHYDIAGFCVGAVDKCNLLDGQKIEAGQVLIGFQFRGTL